MIPINNSDLAWLITADYNQDHNILGAEELREDILDPEVDRWTWHDYVDGNPGARKGIREDIEHISQGYIGGHGFGGGKVGGCGNNVQSFCVGGSVAHQDFGLQQLLLGVGDRGA